MPAIYKYTDKNDGIVKYVGLVRTDERLLPRIRQHAKLDKWDLDSWDIEVAFTDTLCDAEMLEAHCINSFETGKYFNKFKTSWGLCSYAPNAKKLMWLSLDQIRNEIVMNHNNMGFFPRFHSISIYQMNNLLKNTEEKKK